MRRHAAVLTLLARSTIYKVLILCVVLAAAEGALFTLALNRMAAGSLESVVEQSRIAWVFAACFLVMMAALCAVGCEFGSRTGYTLRRLAVTEKGLFFWQAGYNVLCCLLLWAVQLGVALALCRLYTARVGPAPAGSQTVFLAFYRSGFLHSLLPLAEASRWVRNGVMAAGLGFCAACFPFKQRRKKWGIEAPLAVALALMFFSRALGDFGSDMLAVLSFLALAVKGGSYVVCEGEYDEA